MDWKEFIEETPEQAITSRINLLEIMRKGKIMEVK